MGTSIFVSRNLGERETDNGSEGLAARFNFLERIQTELKTRKDPSIEMKVPKSWYHTGPKVKTTHRPRMVQEPCNSTALFWPYPVIVD